MRKTKFKSLAATSLLLIAILSPSIINKVSVFATVPGTNTRVSVDSSGTQGNDNTNSSFMSADGKYIEFGSSATNMVSGDTNSKADVFLKDLTTNSVTRISLSTTGTQLTGGDSFAAGISQNGLYALFRWDFNNQIYEYNRNTGSVIEVTTNSSGVEANMPVMNARISNDGRFAYFTTQATNLGTTITTSAIEHLYVKDMQLNTLTLLDQSGGTQANGFVTLTDISCDGSLVVVTSAATNLTASDTNGVNDVFLFDLRNGVKITNLTQSGNANSQAMNMSCNGNYIGIRSLADTLTSGVPDTSTMHGYVYDRLGNSFSLLDKSTGGTLGDDTVGAVTPSDLGYVIFSSGATNLVTTSTGGNFEIYVRDVANATTQLLSISSGGVAGNANSGGISVTTDGKKAAYSSGSTNLIASDTNAKSDVFISDTGF